MNFSDRIILHLCAKEGSDSMPYKEADYDVRIIGDNIGVENYTPPENVYGIIANPPCTHFSIARTAAKTPRDFKEGMRLVKECLRIIWECQYKSEGRNSSLKFWVIENPATGFLKYFIGKPAYVYNHYEFGYLQSKKTALWGMFNPPIKPLLYNPIPSGYSIGKKNNPFTSKDKRSRCPYNFAKAFFTVNQ